MPPVHRRDALAASAAFMTGVALEPGRTSAAPGADDDLEAAAAVLDTAVSSGRVATAALHVERGGRSFSRGFGQGPAGPADADAIFLLGSISKPIAVTALMTLHDRGQFDLDDEVRRFLPAFTGDGRERVTIRQLLSHVSGLPDQLPENDHLRAAHAPLDAFVAAALRTPLLFAPGTRFGYSSMGILLAARIAETIAGTDIRAFVTSTVLEPLGMRHSAQGLGGFTRERFVRCQTEQAAPEAGGGDPAAAAWDWNSDYWRALGAPWGGTHASAPDVARFLAAFVHDGGGVVKPGTARLMITDQNGGRTVPRGIGFALAGLLAGPGASAATFGHTGSTGTIGWADPDTATICVVLTSLPARAGQMHPRDRVATTVTSQR